MIFPQNKDSAEQVVKSLPTLSMSFGVGSHLMAAEICFEDLPRSGWDEVHWHTNRLMAGPGARGSSWDIDNNISHQMEEEKKNHLLYLSR